MVHFNWSPGNGLVMPDHPEVKSVFTAVLWFFHKAVVNREKSSAFWIWLNIMCTLLRATLRREQGFIIIIFIILETIFLSLALHCGENTLNEKYEVETGARVFCSEKFDSIKRYNYLPPRSSSSLSQFPFNCHFISCSRTFACISATLLNVTAVFAHLQNTLWVITKDSENLFSERALALEFN